MNNEAPNAEAKLTAKQLREVWFIAMEGMIENNWEEVISACETAAMLATHCKDIEDSYGRSSIKTQERDESSLESCF